MNQSVLQEDVVIKNINSPFTEIFTLLTKYQILSDNTLTLAYPPEDQKIMRAHIDNAVENMLQGLQDIGHLMGAVDRNKIQYYLPGDIGSFVTACCNLVEAMIWLKSSCSG